MSDIDQYSERSDFECDTENIQREIEAFDTLEACNEEGAIMYKYVTKAEFVSLVGDRIALEIDFSPVLIALLPPEFDHGGEKEQYRSIWLAIHELINPNLCLDACVIRGNIKMQLHHNIFVKEGMEDSFIM